MIVYPQEIKDGLGELVQASASVAYCAPALMCSDAHQEVIEIGNKVKAQSANPKQVDLFYIKSVLVSTGWNKNDDVFTSEATWNARSTPEDKQFNLMHNENDIIGHITGSYVVDRDGNQLEDDTQPDDFDIITEAVLYNSWTEAENRERMTQIMSEIEEGKWFVSMECLFAGFDYALLDEKGTGQLLSRNESSAFLTKHLRAYGGTGEYEGYKIGRSLREIAFSGKGLVSKPANPRSVILDASKAFCVTSKADINLDFSFTGENDMSDSILEQQLADMKNELATAKEENSQLQTQLDEATSKEYVESIAKLETSVTEAKEAVAALDVAVAEKEAIITELQETLAKDKEDMKEKMEELNKMKKEKKAEARKASLIDLGFDAEEAEESLASYADFDDESFTAIVEAMDKMKKKATVKKEEEDEAKAKPLDSKGKSKPEEDDDKAKAKPPVASKAEEAEEAEAEVAAEEALEEVETTEATLVDASDETEELEATRASVSEWLENNVLSK